MADQQMMVLVQMSAAGAIRTETLLEREFRVIPAVLVRSQVLHNNLGATYLPANDMTPEWADVWNGMPVLVGPHPTMRGQPISGRSPALWNERGAGWIFNATLAIEEAGVRRLKAEVWLDVERAANVVGLPEVLERLAAGQPVELSTGFPAKVVNQSGVFQDQAYDVILRPLGADHLVVSAEMTGACSVADGCGLGVNSQESTRMAEDTGKEEGRATGFKAVLERVTSLVGRSPKRESKWAENTAHQLARELEILNSVEPSDQERANMCRDALQAALGSVDKTVVVCDVYSTEGLVVFWFMTPFGPEPQGAEYYRCTYEVGENGAYVFGVPERVRRMYVYEPSSSASPANAANATNGKPCGCGQEGTNMLENEKKEIVNELMGGLKTALAEGLSAINEKLSTVATDAKTAAEGAVNAAIESFKTQIGELKTQVESAVNAVNADRESEKATLIVECTTNDRTPFTAEELQGRSLEEVRKIAQMAKIEVTSYTGRGSVRAPATNADASPKFAEPVPYFQKAAEPAATK